MKINKIFKLPTNKLLPVIGSINSKNLIVEENKKALKFTFGPFIPFCIYSIIHSNLVFLFTRMILWIFKVFYVINKIITIHPLFSHHRNLFEGIIASMPNKNQTGMLLLSIFFAFLSIFKSIILFDMIFLAIVTIECFSNGNGLLPRLKWNILIWPKDTERLWNNVGLIFFVVRILVLTISFLMFSYIYIK